MPTNERQQIESNLRVALENNTNFRHYDMDRVYTAIHSSPYQNKTIEFELLKGQVLLILNLFLTIQGPLTGQHNFYQKPHQYFLINGCKRIHTFLTDTSMKLI